MPIKRPTIVLLLTLCFTFSSGFFSVSYALWGFGEKDPVLVSVNEDQLTAADFRHWWAEWQEEGMELPERPEAFVDWILLWREAEKMELYEKESYRYKVDVFRKVWSLMLLKQEEIDSQIVNPPREELWKDYLNDYAPRLSLRMVRVADPEKVTPMQKAVESGHTLAEAAVFAKVTNVADLMDNSGFLRPQRIPEPLRRAVRQLPPGQIAGPVNWENAWYFLEVLERESVSEEDFQKNRDTLTRSWQKKKSAELTAALVEKAKVKYEVSIDQEVVEAIGFEPLDAKLAAQPAVFLGDDVIRAQAIADLLAKERTTRPNADMATLRQGVINDMLAQTLTGLEALDRHYETKPPFSHTFKFYQQHRLIKELEKEIFWPQIKINEEDIRQAYQQNIELYSSGGMVELAQIQTREKDLARQLSARLSAGEDFYALMRPLAPSGVQTEKIPLNHLSSPVREIVADMVQGETRSWETPEGETLFIKVVRLDLLPSLPLEQVSETIRQTLRQSRYEKVRSQYVDILRERSTIKVNERVWKNIREQLVKEAEPNATF